MLLWLAQGLLWLVLRIIWGSWSTVETDVIRTPPPSLTLYHQKNLYKLAGISA